MNEATNIAYNVGLPTGLQLINDPGLNKGTAFTEAERIAYGLRGLLPPRVNTMEEQVRRVLGNYGRKTSDIERYIFLAALKDRNRTLFYRVLLENLEEMMPILYTPTVGKACQEYVHIYRRPSGIFISATNKGHFRDNLRNWPNRNVRVIVVTDGERILGLGDLGVAGMGIPIGKLVLYTACAGIHPSWCLPVTIDVGTNNTALQKDPLYFGLQHERIRGDAYDELLEEFIVAVGDNFPRCLIQFEDFGNTNAFRLLNRYKDRICTFNDDIQGTAAVALAGLFSAMRVTRGKLKDQKILFLGAGEAGTGIGNLIVSAMADEGISASEARQRLWFIDSKGLVCSRRENLAEHKLPYAHDHEYLPDLLSAVKALKPGVIIGVSGQQNAFTSEIIQEMGKINKSPIIFALSNPTDNAECTAEAAYKGTEGRAIFAGGSPFGPVKMNGRTFTPGQGNNAYIFPGIGLGVAGSKAARVTDEMFLTAARVLAQQVTDAELSTGSLYPRLNRIREISAEIASAVAQLAHERGLAKSDLPKDMKSHLLSLMWEPIYQEYV